MGRGGGDLTLGPLAWRWFSGFASANCPSGGAGLATGRLQFKGVVSPNVGKWKGVCAGPVDVLGDGVVTGVCHDLQPTQPRRLVSHIWTPRITEGDSGVDVFCCAEVGEGRQVDDCIELAHVSKG